VAACACSSATHDDTSGDAERCSLAAGTYTLHFEAENAGTACPPIPPQTMNVKDGESFVGSTSLPAGVAPGCTAATDTSTCTITESCTSSLRGVKTTIELELVYSTTEITGKETITKTAAVGPSRSTCSYDISTTRE
jgi:hypothetical protein